MHAWGTIPDWITAAATALSCGFLIDYAVSARKLVVVSQKQIEAISKPVLVVIAIGEDIRIMNIGSGPALNVVWSPSDQTDEIGTLEAMQVDNFQDLRGSRSDMAIRQAAHKRPFIVDYSSVSGRTYRTKAFVRLGDKHNQRTLELKIEEH